MGIAPDPAFSPDGWPATRSDIDTCSDSCGLCISNLSRAVEASGCHSRRAETRHSVISCLPDLTHVTVTCRVKGSFFLVLVPSPRLETHNLHGGAQRVVQLLSDICVGHAPTKVLNRRYKHPSSGERIVNIYSLRFIQRTVEADGDPEVIDNLEHQHFIWGTSLLEYFARIDSRNLLVFFITETYTRV